MRLHRWTLCMLLGVGCTSLVPSERAEKQATATAEKLALRYNIDATRRLTALPELHLQVSGTNNTTSVQVPMASLTATERSGLKEQTSTEEQSWWESVVSIPLGVKLILIGLGVLLILVALWFARKSSRAFAAAYAAGDRMAAGVIGHLEHAISTCTDPAQLAALNTVKANAEKQRGQFNKGDWETTT